MKTYITTLLLFLSSISSFAKVITVVVHNKTGQLLTSLDYWFGSPTEANASGLNYSSKGTMGEGASLTIPIDFHKKKRNTLLIRGYLSGGGYISQKYTISEGETAPKVAIYNLAVPVNTQDFTDVMNTFSSLKLKNNQYQVSEQNALDALIGSMILYVDENTIKFKILPGDLKTRARKIDVPSLNRTISGVFSSATAINGGLSLPFVSASTTFSSSDVAKFSWEIEDVGEYNWTSLDNKDLATLFNSLSDNSKKVLFDLYEANPNLKMKFIDKAFVIGRLEVKSSKTKKISNDYELNGANYVTAKGNYAFLDNYEDSFILKNVITQIDGYDVTALLSSLYLTHKSEKAAALTAAENDRVKNEYALLRTQFPGLKETTDIAVMKKVINEINNPINTSKLLGNSNKEQISVRSIQ